jgi:protein SCO1/2
MRTTIDRRLLLFAGGAVIAVLLGTGLFLGLSSPHAPGIGGPFTLEDTQGRTVTDRDFQGHWMLVYFGYSFCPDVCPTTLNDVAEALDKLGTKGSNLQPVFITIDPQRDTPKALADYVGAFSPRLVGLTGTPEQIGAVAREYRVYVARHATGPGPDDYTMDHSSVLYLVAPDGHFVAAIRADQSPDLLAADLAKRIL